MLTPELPTPEPNPPMDDPALLFEGSAAFLLDAIIDQLPEFLSVYVSLAEACDGDPGEAAVFGALADFVSGHLSLLETSRPVLQRALGLVESLLDAPVDLEPSGDPGTSVDADHRGSEEWDDWDGGDGISGWEGSDDLADLVRLGFFDGLSAEERTQLTPWLGPRSLAALGSLDDAGPDRQ